jgi:hypothetical protein
MYCYYFLLLLYFILLFWQSYEYYLSTDFLQVTFIGYNFEFRTTVMFVIVDFDNISNMLCMYVCNLNI